MKKGKGLLTLALGTVMAFSVAGVTAFAEQTDGAQDSALAMNTVLSTVEGYSSNGASQVRTTEELTGAAAMWRWMRKHTAYARTALPPSRRMQPTARGSI